MEQLVEKFNLSEPVSLDTVKPGQVVAVFDPNHNAMSVVEVNRIEGSHIVFNKEGYGVWVSSDAEVYVV